MLRAKELLREAQVPPILRTAGEASVSRSDAVPERIRIKPPLRPALASLILEEASLEGEASSPTHQ